MVCPPTCKYPTDRLIQCSVPNHNKSEMSVIVVITAPLALFHCLNIIIWLWQYFQAMHFLMLLDRHNHPHCIPHCTRSWQVAMKWQGDLLDTWHVILVLLSSSTFLILFFFMSKWQGDSPHTWLVSSSFSIFSSDTDGHWFLSLNQKYSKLGLSLGV